MKLVLYEDRNAIIRPGVLTNGGVADISAPVATVVPNAGDSMQRLMELLIDNFEALRPEIEKAIASVAAEDLEKVKLRPPLPRPSKILCCIGNYWEHAQREARPLNMFLKSPDAVIGPGDTIELPPWTDPYVYQHEAELAIVFKGPAKDVSQDDAASAIFGYTALIDVSARAEGRRTWRAGSWMGKSFDTFAPIGPCIVTADEIPDPNALAVKFWNDGQLRHDYNTNDMEHRVPELVEFATGIMTMNSGDLLSCGTNHEGLGALQDGETVEIEIERIGRFSVSVVDPLKRTWERGVYQGADSTYRGPNAL
jgi:2-keto-4-pentenoate hydratase/2-oxohepta-3-ene-1,7-dioic acid hydratase in catechol pathway